jgi:hypothetical protein
VRFDSVRRMNHITEAAAAQLASRRPNDEPVTAEEMVRLLARIARTGPAAARLRALELLGERMGLFRTEPAACPIAALSEDDRADRIAAILDRARMRREAARQ